MSMYASLHVVEAYGGDSPVTGGESMTPDATTMAPTWRYSQQSQIIHVWYIYLQNWVIYGVNVGKYTIHG